MNKNFTFFAGGLLNSREEPAAARWVDTGNDKLIKSRRLFPTRQSLQPISIAEPGSHRRLTGADEKRFYQFADFLEGSLFNRRREKGYRDYKIALVTVRPGEMLDMGNLKCQPPGAVNCEECRRHNS